jgi:hypothetical protein
MRISISMYILLMLTNMTSQEPSKNPLPYHNIPDYPETYTAGTVVARMIDGLGFRYYWATYGLTADDLSYRPTDRSRTVDETVDHLYHLSLVIHNSARKEVNDRTVPQDAAMAFDQKRRQTLLNLKMASDIFKNVADLADHEVIFKNKNGIVKFPFWNQINGPIEDAVWHSGQLAVLRRAAGNPIDPEVNVFLGVRGGK